jgi:hypothetical protein
MLSTSIRTWRCRMQVGFNKPFLNFYPQRSHGCWKVSIWSQLAWATAIWKLFAKIAGNVFTGTMDIRSLTPSVQSA